MSDVESSADDHYDTNYLSEQLERIDALHQSEVSDIECIIRILEAELVIYRDVIPLFEINEPSAAEMRLINLYQKFLQSLVAMVEPSNPMDIRTIGARIISELASFSFAFNFNRPLLSVLIRCANDQLLCISQPCVEVVRSLILDDASSRMMLIVLDELTDLVEEKSSKQPLIKPMLLRCLLLLHTKHVDMHQTIERSESRKAPGDVLSLQKELKRKKSRVDKKLQGDHQTEVAGDTASIQSGLLQKTIYLFLRIFKSSSERKSQARHGHTFDPASEESLITILQGLLKFGEHLNTELIDLLMQALWDLFQSIEAKLQKGALRSSGAIQIQCIVLQALDYFSRQLKHISLRCTFLHPNAPFSASRVPNDVQSLQQLLLGILDDALALPMAYSDDYEQSSQANTRNFLEDAVRMSWTNQTETCIETARALFDIDKNHRIAIASRHKKHKRTVSNETRALLEKLLGHALSSPPCIYQRLKPTVDALITTFAESFDGVHFALYDDSPYKGAERDNLYWNAFAYRAKVEAAQHECLDDAFKWMY